MNKEIRDIRVVFLIFSGIFSLVAYKLYPHPASYLLFMSATLLLILLLFTPLTLKPLFAQWMKFALILGKINTKILLTLFFIIAFIPMGLFMKFRGKDPLSKSFSDDETYWKPYELSGLKDRHRYEKQF